MSSRVSPYSSPCSFSSAVRCIWHVFFTAAFPAREPRALVFVIVQFPSGVPHIWHVFFSWRLQRSHARVRISSSFHPFRMYADPPCIIPPPLHSFGMSAVPSCLITSTLFALLVFSSPRSVSSRVVLCSRAPHSRASPASLRFFRTPCGSDLWFHFK